MARWFQLLTLSHALTPHPRLRHAQLAVLTVAVGPPMRVRAMRQLVHKQYWWSDNTCNTFASCLSRLKSDMEVRVLRMKTGISSAARN